MIRAQRLMDALKDPDALGELDAWIVDELAHLRRFSKALSILAAAAEC